jgi:hypothetical protein
MGHRIIHVHPKRLPCLLAPKIQICCFQIGEYVLDEIELIECTTSGKHIEHEKFLCGEEHRNNSFFAPTACRVLGMTFSPGRLNIFADTVVC